MKFSLLEETFNRRNLLTDEFIKRPKQFSSRTFHHSLKFLCIGTSMCIKTKLFSQKKHLFEILKSKKKKYACLCSFKVFCARLITFLASSIAFTTPAVFSVAVTSGSYYFFNILVCCYVLYRFTIHLREAA